MKLTFFILIYLFVVLPTYAIDDQTNDNEDQGQYVDSGWDEEDKKKRKKNKDILEKMNSMKMKMKKN